MAHVDEGVGAVVAVTRRRTTVNLCQDIKETTLTCGQGYEGRTERRWHGHPTQGPEEAVTSAFGAHTTDV